MAATAILIDSREPANIQGLQFGGAIPVSVTMLPYGDAMAACEDGTIVLIERKTLSDLLNSIQDGRIFHQVAGMLDQTRWAYLVITEPLQYGPAGKLLTSRGETGWSFNSVAGALTTIQELGAFVVFCPGEQDYEACVLRLAGRNHEEMHPLEPVKFPHILSAQEQVLAAFPGIGFERASTLLAQFGTPAQALAGLTDPKSQIDGIKGGLKAKVRNALKLAESEQLIVVPGPNGQEWVEIVKSYIQEKVHE